MNLPSIEASYNDGHYIWAFLKPNEKFWGLSFFNPNKNQTAFHVLVAQLVEHRAENSGVAGSSPV